MTPEEIILKHVSAIPGMRVPEARRITAAILKDIKDEGLENEIMTVAIYGQALFKQPTKK